MNRRSRAAALALLAVAPVAFASTARGDDSGEKKKEALLASDWFKKGDWTADLDKAKAESRRTGKLVLVYFTVTDRESPFCRNIEKSLLPDEKFVEWSRKFVCYCQVTTAPAKSYDELARASGTAWPWFAFLDASGSLIHALRPAMSLKAYEEAGERVLHYVELGRRAQKGGDAENRDLVIAALDLGRIKPDDAHARLAKLGELTDAQKKALEQAESNAFVSEIAMKTDTNDKEAHLAAARKFLEHRKAKKPLPTERADIQAYWIALLRLAVEEKDVALYEEGLNALKERYGAEPSTKAYFEGCAKTLEELKAAEKK